MDDASLEPTGLNDGGDEGWQQEQQRQRQHQEEDDDIVDVDDNGVMDGGLGMHGLDAADGDGDGAVDMIAVRKACYSCLTCDV